MTGLGSEGNVRGPVEFFPRILHMPLYYLSRFAPWSILSTLAMVALWSRGAAGTAKRTRYWQEITHGAGAWLHGAAILVVLIVALFTLSTGKRADYIAAAIPPGSLLAAWWLLRIPPRWGITAPWLAPAAAVVGESVVAFELALAFLEKFGGDSLDEIMRNYQGYLEQIKSI